MKKNLRNILVLAMGLMTTVSFAQDWNVDSRTRMDMSEATNGEGYMSTDQRATLGATWGGSDWGVHVSTDVNYTLGGTDATLSVSEAYASTNLMGFASLTAGRQALNYGSGALMSSNDWAKNRTTWDGMTFGLNLDMADITVGYHTQNAGTTPAVDADTVAGTAAEEAIAHESTGEMWINASGEFSGWNLNVLYMTRTDEMADAGAATGIDISGELMGASISASMNTDYDDGDMMTLGVSYAVNDDMSVTGGYTTYGETGFNMAGTNMSGGFAGSGQLGYLGANDEDMSLGLTYTMAGINLGATMHMITDSEDETYERDVMEISLGYSLGDNADLAVSYATDSGADFVEGSEDSNYMWVTLNIRP